MTSVTLARNAMASRFEIILYGENAPSLRAAGEEALEEIGQLEAQLSLYRPSSEMARLNATAGQRPIRVEPGFFALLQRARQLHLETQGAFDVTIGPLMRCWGFMGGEGKKPPPEKIATCMSSVGMKWIELNPEDHTVRFLREGVMIDLGAIGKGYAIERAVEVLLEAGVTRALIHGGTSTLYAIGTPPDDDAWRVGIELPPSVAGAGHDSAEAGGQASEMAPDSSPPVLLNQPGRTIPPNVLAVVSLKNEALSVSAVQGKFFESEGQTYGHVIDPRSGYPSSRTVMAAVAVPSATDADALSTALLTAGITGLDPLAKARPGVRALALELGKTSSQWVCGARGISLTETASPKVITVETENKIDNDRPTG